MAGFSESSNRNNMLSSLWQQSNEQSNFMSRNDGYGQTLVLYRSKVFINLDGNTITDDSFNNKGNGNQDFSYADINRIVSAIRNKNSSPVPAPAPAINTVYTNPNQHHGSSSAVESKTWETTYKNSHGIFNQMSKTNVFLDLIKGILVFV
ncbi:unnamed protein product [Sphenostylis stenocarpa]|uniref:Uncharacterized protein n=1 Tax=Sphenostylis stenocarpa TaxID=92480 RepID=A0AA86SI45_9FABA|nr:unnamed protein product [Sphenostylis stenocarpa]